LLSRVGRTEEILELVFALLLVQAIVWRDSTNGSRALKVGEPQGMAALD
jgi:hypothetical protein